MSPSLMHEVMIWSLIIVSVSLVAGITYVYTNRNTKVTWLFTLVSIAFVFLLKIISIVDLELGMHFLGEYQSPDSTTVVAGPGLGLLLHAWHIWLLPVTIVFLIFIFVIYFLMGQFSSEKLKIHSLHSRETSSTASAQNKPEQTRAERLNAMMMIDAAKKQSRIANQKLSESLLANAAYEIKINDLTAQVSSLEENLHKIQNASNESVVILQTELSKKKDECTLLNIKLGKALEDLEKAKTLLRKAAEMTKKKPE